MAKKEISTSIKKSIFGAIPYIGTALNESFFDYRSRLKQQRINEFIENLIEYLTEKEIASEAINRIKSEDFSDFFEDVIRKVSELRSVEKKKRLSVVLVNQIIEPSEFDFTKTYLDIISKINEVQILILSNHISFEPQIQELEYRIIEIKSEINSLDKELKRSSSQKLNQRSPSEIDRDIAKKHLLLKDTERSLEKTNLVRKHEFYSIEEGEFKFYLQDLVSKSLMHDIGLGSFDYEPFTIMQVTEFGKRFMRFIEER